MRSLLYIFVLASCAQVTDVPPGEGVVTIDKNSDDFSDEMELIDRIELPVYALDDSAPTPPEPCEGFPADGACSQACNPDALRAYIPPGTCATFECPTSDGSTVRVGGCVLPDE